MKVWEETWTAWKEHGGACYDESTAWWNVDQPSEGTIALRLGEPEAKLIAASPDMARVLLRVEFAVCGHGECPSCGRTSLQGHHSDCALDVALRKAGVR